MQTWQKFWSLGLIAFLFLLLWHRHAVAHMTSMGTLMARIDSEKRQVRLVVSVSRDDMGTYLKLDRNHDKRIDDDELQGHRPTVERYIAERLLVSNNSRVCEVTEQSFLPKQELMSKRRLFFRQVWVCEQPLEQIVIQNKILFEDIGGYRHVGRIQWENQIYTTIFSLTFPHYRLDVRELRAASEASKAKQKTEQNTSKMPAKPVQGGQGFWSVFQRFLLFGMQHILVGIDHIAFVLCLLVVAHNMRQLVLVVSAFTVGHSLTLLLSVMGWLVVSQPITEVLIAITIAYVAIENMAPYYKLSWFRGLMVGLTLLSLFSLGWLLWLPLLRKSVGMWQVGLVAFCLLSAAGLFVYYLWQIEKVEISGHRFWLTAAFGMIHGIGFSYSFQELKLPKTQLVAALFSFNVGVEIGQLIVVLLAFPWLYRMVDNERYPKFLTGFCLLTLFLSGYWIVVRSIWPGT